MVDFDATLLEQYMTEYYKNLYPLKLILRWLSYNEEANKYLTLREFAFILRDDVHMRYRSYANEVEMRQDLCRYKPEKIDIGPVYNYPPKEKQKFIDFKAQERELVFDIDLTDYDVYRTCCKEARVCTKCWRWMTIAVCVLDVLLREHFGFKHLLFLFSGRRGVHCWVADKTARALSSTGRSAVAEYLSYDKTKPPYSKKCVHPMGDLAYRTIMQSGEMQQLVLEQGWLTTSQQWENVLKLCPDADVRDAIRTEFSELKTAEDRWELLLRRFDAAYRRNNENKVLPSEEEGEAKHFLLNFVLTYAYPKLDVNVTTGLNHLLKSPFSVHPKTGTIAVPLLPQTVYAVELTELPRIDKLINEITKAAASGDTEKENRKTLYYKHTALAPYVQIFEDFVNGICANGN